MSFVTPAQEADIVKFVLWMADHHLPLTTSDIQIIVTRLAKHGKQPNLRWAQKFVRRHNLSLKSPNIIHHGRAAIACEENFQQHFNTLNLILSSAEYAPASIINMNETGWSKQQHRRSVIYRKGKLFTRPSMKLVMTNEHITSVHSIAADGTCLPTMIIFKSCAPKFADGEYPSKFIIRSSESGFINSDLFVDWLKSIVITYRTSKPGPFLLTMDNASPHLSLEAVLLCIQHAIEIFALLPNASGWLQPLDQIFNILKHHAYEISRSLSLSVGGFITNKKKFPYILSLAEIAAFKPSVVASSFRHTGIHPFNPDAVSRVGIRPLSSTPTNDSPLESIPDPDPCPECKRPCPCNTCLRNANPLNRIKLLSDPITQAMLQPPSLPEPSNRKRHIPMAKHLTCRFKNCFIHDSVRHNPNVHITCTMIYFYPGYHSNRLLVSICV